jgi:hypothetical protein
MSCVRTGGAHAAVLLGLEDDGRFVHRCGNCGDIGYSADEQGAIEFKSEEEGGGPDLIRAAIPALSIAEKG